MHNDTDTHTSENTSEQWARAIIGGLFLALAWRLGGDFLRTHRATDLLLLVGEALVVVLTCLRRRATIVDRRACVRVVTVLSMGAPLMVRPIDGAGLVPEAIAATAAGIGLLVVVAGKVSLGYSFGLLPANRGVIDRGLYRIVRHPIYLGYLMTHVPFLAAHPTWWNAIVLIGGDIALGVRALYEEQTLSRDPKYSRYCLTVKWRLLPGVC